MSEPATGRRWWSDPIVRDSLGVAFATGAYGISMGAIGVASGLDVWQTCATSLLIFTGASQFAMAGVIGAGGAPMSAAATGLLLAAHAVVPGGAVADPAGSCEGRDGVVVVVDFAELGGGVTKGCSADGGTAAELFRRAGFDLTRVTSSPGFVCRVAGKPADVGCAETPPVDAYWSLWTANGTAESWSYAQSGVDGQRVAEGGYVAFAWHQGGGRAAARQREASARVSSGVGFGAARRASAKPITPSGRNSVASTRIAPIAARASSAKSPLTKEKPSAVTKTGPAAAAAIATPAAHVARVISPSQRRRHFR